MINLILSAVPSLQLYTIMFRLCSQPTYWITMAVSPTTVSPYFFLSQLQLGPDLIDFTFHRMLVTPSRSQLMVAVGMGPVMAFRYFKNLYRPSDINILQQIEQSNGSIQTSGNLESALLSRWEPISLIYWLGHVETGVLIIILCLVRSPQDDPKEAAARTH